MLPNYDPDIKQCPKCGGELMKLQWRPAAGDTTTQDTRLLGEYSAPYEEHFRRDCNSCGFYWYEQVYDTPGPPLLEE